MTGIAGLNYGGFTRAALELRGAGHAVISPIEVDHPGESAPGSLTWAAYLRNDLAALLTCDAIALLPGWPSSRGARVELAVALGLKFGVYFYQAGGALVPMAEAPESERLRVISIGTFLQGAA